MSPPHPSALRLNADLLKRAGYQPAPLLGSGSGAVAQRVEPRPLLLRDRARGRRGRLGETGAQRIERSAQLAGGLRRRRGEILVLAPEPEERDLLAAGALRH